MQSLKKSFEYANYLSQTINNLQSCLEDSRYTTQSQKLLRRSESDSSAIDMTEIVNDPSQTDLGDYKVEDVIDTLMFVTDEYCNLNYKISKAKFDDINDNFDSMIAENRIRRQVNITLSRLATSKPTTQNSTGSSYRMNEEGNQVPYQHPVTLTKTLRYDPAKVKALSNKINSDASAMSDKLDVIQLTRMVDHDAVFDITDSLTDVVDKYLTLKS